MKIQLVAATCLLCLASVSAHASCYANGKNYQKGTRVNGDYGNRIECGKGGWKNTLDSNHRTNKGNASRSSSSYSKHNSSKSYNKPTPSNYGRRGGYNTVEY